MNTTKIGIIVHGASGRMGSRICQLALSDKRFELVDTIDRGRAPGTGTPAAPGVIGSISPQITPSSSHSSAVLARVVIDFSSDEGARSALRIALERDAALLVGTTALSEPTLTALRDASSKIGVIVAPNTSPGVAACADAIARLARALGPGYRASIVEAHHIHKKDAPSGTAIRLARAARDAGADLPDDQVFAIRAGDIVGEHTVRFAGPGEEITLVHRATSRDLFASGALRAAAWLAQRGAGWYRIEDVLGMSTT